MALPMKILNVRYKVVNFVILRRCFSLGESRALISNFSHTANKNPSDEENDNREDFFGIPEDFKLQHARHSLPQNLDKSNSQSAQSTESADSTDDLYARETTQPEPEIRLSRKERRMNKLTAFKTTFGTISLDNTVSQSFDINTENLTRKAHEILNKLHTTDFRRLEQRKEKQENKKESNSSRTSEEQDNVNYQGRLKSNSFSRLHNAPAPTSNYLDEVYFPEHSRDEDTNISHPALHQNSQVSESALRSTKPHSSSEANNIESNLPNDIVKHDEHSERSSSYIDEQYFSTHILHENNENLNSSEKLKQNNWSQKRHENSKHTSFEISSETAPPKESQTKKKGVDEMSVDFNEIDDRYFGNVISNFNSKNDSTIRNTVSSPVDMNIGSPSLDEVVADYETNPGFNTDKKKSPLAEITHQQKPGILESRRSREELVKEKLENDHRRMNEESAQKRLENDHKRKKKELVKEKVDNDHRRMNEEPAQKRLDCDSSHHITMENEEAVQPDITDKLKNASRRLDKAAMQEEPDADSQILSSEDFLRNKRTNKRVQPNLEKPETAYDVAMKIRHGLRAGRLKAEDPLKDFIEAYDNVDDAMEDGRHTESGVKLDSKGYRVLDDQLPDFNKMTSADIVRMLKNRIIFDHEDFLAIDKPYGLACYKQPQERVSITELLPAFAAILPASYKTSDLHLVQALDRDVTGAIILAKSPEVASILRGMYRESDMVVQRFWAVTKGVPNPEAGIVDIPIGEAKVGDVYKMVLRPRFLKELKAVDKTSKAPSKRAITEYKILSSYLQSALVECTLQTNRVKHQIRLHLASGLSTPVLGDHKYSNFDVMAPQKLHPEMLELLKMRQAKVRHLALHLHCRSVILKAYKGRMIFLTTYPPSHFRDNLKSLRLSMPKK